MLCVIFCDLFHCYLAYTVDCAAAADAPKTKLTLGLESTGLAHEYIYIYMHITKSYLILHCMMTSSNGNIFRVTGHCAGNSPVPGEFPTQRPVTRSFDVLFDLRLNQRLSKQSWGWWFEMLSRPLWRHCNATLVKCCMWCIMIYSTAILVNNTAVFDALGPLLLIWINFYPSMDK